MIAVLTPITSPVIPDQRTAELPGFDRRVRLDEIVKRRAS